MSTAALPLKTIVYETKTAINSKQSLTKSDAPSSPVGAALPPPRADRLGVDAQASEFGQ
jgi:hypothetical protein